MATVIPEALRRTVSERADGCCEDCGKPQVSFFAHEVDQVRLPGTVARHWTNRERTNW